MAGAIAATMGQQAQAADAHVFIYNFDDSIEGQGNPQASTETFTLAGVGDTTASLDASIYKSGGKFWWKASPNEWTNEAALAEMNQTLGTTIDSTFSGLSNLYSSASGGNHSTLTLDFSDNDAYIIGSEVVIYMTVGTSKAENKENGVSVGVPSNYATAPTLSGLTSTTVYYAKDNGEGFGEANAADYSEGFLIENGIEKASALTLIKVTGTLDANRTVTVKYTDDTMQKNGFGMVAVSVTPTSDVRLEWGTGDGTWTAESFHDQAVTDGSTTMFHMGALEENAMVTVSGTVQAHMLDVAAGEGKTYSLVAADGASLSIGALAIESGTLELGMDVAIGALGGAGKLGIASGNATVTFTENATINLGSFAVDAGETMTLAGAEGVTLTLSDLVYTQAGDLIIDTEASFTRTAPSGQTSGNGRIVVGEHGKLSIHGGDDAFNWDARLALSVKGILEMDSRNTVSARHSLEIQDGGSVVGGSFHNNVGSDSFVINASGTSSMTSAALSTGRGVEFNVAKDGRFTMSGNLGDHNNGGVSSGTFTKTGEGTMVFSGSMLLTHGLSVQAGTLEIGANTALDGAKYVVRSGAILDVKGQQDKAWSLELDGGTFTNSGNGHSDSSMGLTNVRLTANSEINAANKINVLGYSYGATTLDLGTSTLTKTGSADLYLLNTTITAGEGGTIKASEGKVLITHSSGGEKLGGASLVLDGGIIEMTGSSDVVNVATAISNTEKNGTIQVGAGNTLKVTSATGNYSGTIGGEGSLHIAGGEQTLTGDNTYAGGTTISGGATLATGKAGALGLGAITIEGGSTLKYNKADHTQNLTYNLNGGTIDLMGGGGIGTKDTEKATVTLSGEGGTISASNAALYANIGGEGKLMLKGGDTALTAYAGISHTGDVELADGKINLGNWWGGSASLTNTGDVNVTGATVLLDQGSTIANTGKVNISGGSVTMNNGTSIANTGEGSDVNVTGSGQLIINSGATVSSTIKAGEVATIGARPTVMRTASDPVYTDVVVTADGISSIAGKAGSVSNAAIDVTGAYAVTGTTLTGTTLTVSDAGTLTLTNVTMGDGSTLVLNGVGDSAVSVSGTLTFNAGSTLDLSKVALTSPDQTLTFLSNTSGLTEGMIMTATGTTATVNGDGSVTLSGTTTPPVLGNNLITSVVGYDESNNILTFKTDMAALSGDVALTYAAELWNGSNPVKEAIYAETGSYDAFYSPDGLLVQLTDASGNVLDLNGVTSLTLNGYAGIGNGAALVATPDGNGAFGYYYGPSIPEPTTTTLSLLALAALAARRRRK